ncbi:Pectate lyase superfamily protein, partial [uncultured Caudovirales phage]
MSATLTPSPFMQFFDLTGAPLVGGTLETFAAGTSTPLATYTDASGLVANPTTITLNTRGEAAVWLGPVAYKLTLKDAAGVLIWTSDNITTQDAINALTAFETSLANTTSSTQGSSLVGYVPASGPPGRTVQAKLRDVVSVKDFGAVGDGSTDDTTALRAAIAYCESATQYGGRALYIPGGRYKITSSLTISKEFITIFGDGAWESRIYAVGLSTSALTTASMQYLRPFLHDFAVQNTGTGKGIDFGNITGQVYLGELKNLYIESGDDGFYAPHFFSMSMINVSSLSRTGHSFRVACGPGVNWIGCYALECGPGKAGYRLRGSILLNACNGLNEGDFWGVFGSNPSNLDGFQNDFDDNDFPDITLLNCNLERWGSLTTGGEAVRVVNTYRTFTFLGGKIDRFDLATNYSAIINCFTGSNGGTEPVRLGIGALFLGGGTPSLANLYSSGQAFYFDVNDQFYFSGITSFKQSATVYPILRQWVAGDIYGNNAHYFSAISPRRTSLQMVRYAE